MAEYRARVSVSNANPHQNSRVTVYGGLRRVGAGGPGQSVAGVRMVATWHFRTRSSQCSAITDNEGRAECSSDIGRATKGYTVVIDVVFVNRDDGHLIGETKVSFTPQ